MSICLSMIVKNEAKVIRRCLRSVKPFIDSYSISDTGSTDNTMEIIRIELVGIPGVLESDAWQDFATNRNFALSRCVGDFVLTIDADEVLEPVGNSIAIEPDFDGFYAETVHGSLRFWHTRIIRNDPGWEWKNKIHEGLYFHVSPKIGKLESFVIRAFDDSNRNQLGDKFERDLKIFESEPPTHRNVFYHAQTLYCLNRLEEAKGKFLERAAMGGWDEEVYYSLFRVGEIMHRLGYPIDETAGALFRAYCYRPSRYEALVRLCVVLRELNRWEQIYQLTAFEPKPGDDVLFIDTDAAGFLFQEHALAAQQLGKLDESSDYFRRAATLMASHETPGHWLNLSLAYYQAERYPDCITAAQRALALKPDSVTALINLCAAHNKLGNFAVGKKAGEEAVRLDPNNQLAKNNLAWSIRELNKQLS